MVDGMITKREAWQDQGEEAQRKAMFAHTTPGSVVKLPEGMNPLDVQIGGGHYKSKPIQPVEYSAANKLNFLEACIVKRITRWREKNGLEDLLKIKHEVDLLIELERKYGDAATKIKLQEKVAAP
jgi:hypothetical protein